MPPTPDPRSIITPDAFSVAPHLLGLPLASARRRAAAMAIDLLLVAVLVNVGGSVLFGVAIAWVFFRVARRRGPRVLPRPLRVAFGVLGAVVLFAAATSLWGRVFDEDDAGPPAPQAPGGSRAGMGNALLMGAELLALKAAETEADAYEHARAFAARMRTVRVPEAEVRRTLGELAAETEKPAVRQGIERALGELGPPPDTASSRSAADSLSRAYAAALAERDTARARAVRPALAAALAADTLRAAGEEIRELRGEMAALERRNDALEEELQEEREGVGVLAFLGKVADDMGLGFGWTGLYFTAFLALWRGQTPGKRLLGLRVVRLGGAPIGWWAAFERFGGYAASLFTGLLGFFQILWDRNRQALHDKITETVVIREGGERAVIPEPGSAGPGSPG